MEPAPRFMCGYCKTPLTADAYHACSKCGICGTLVHPQDWYGPGKHYCIPIPPAPP
jgi:uncharacterized CHY-type Zn-finger protein